MIEHTIIPPFSHEWFIYNTITIVIIIGTIFLCKKLENKQKNFLTNSLAAIFIFEFIFMDFYHLFIDNSWSLQDSLPLHLCGLMWFLSIYLFLTKKQWAFEMVLFIGMPGALHSLMTPQLTHGSDLLHKIDFFIGHGGLVLAPFYAVFVLNMWPRKHAWWKSFIRLQLLVLVVGLINYFIGSNYMYLMHPPIANNPLIPSTESFFGQGNRYILIFEIAVIIHAAIINLPFFLKSKN